MKLFTVNQSQVQPGLNLCAGQLCIGNTEVAVDAALSSDEDILRADIEEEGGRLSLVPEVLTAPAILRLQESLVGFDPVCFEEEDLVASCSGCRVLAFSASAQSHSFSHSPSWCVVSSLDALLSLQPGASVELHTRSSAAVGWGDLVRSLFGVAHKRRITVQRTRYSFDGSTVRREALPALSSIEG